MPGSGHLGKCTSWMMLLENPMTGMSNDWHEIVSPKRWPESGGKWVSLSPAEKILPRTTRFFRKKNIIVSKNIFIKKQNIFLLAIFRADLFWLTCECAIDCIFCMHSLFLYV